jgi:hypothetical protein
MSAKTRYFVIVSLLILGVGLGTGLVAYYVGFPATAFFSKNGPEELRYMPATATVVGAVEVREIMASDLRQRLKEKIGSDAQDNSRRQFQELTGINFETDIERVVACFDSHSSADNTALALARGTFDETKIEALMREHGADVQDYKGKKLIIASKLAPEDSAGSAFEKDADPAQRRLVAHRGNMALAFIEPGLVAFGGRPLVEQAIDLHTGGGSSAATNEDLVAHIHGLEGSNAWVVGRLDALRERAKLPDIVANQIPPITWFTIRGQIDGGIAARITAEAKDDESANQLRDVVRGFLALAKLQTSSKPEFQRFVQSLQLGGTGTTVSLALEVPAQVFDALGTVIPRNHPQQ